ncbi:hypothetical protein Tco_0561542 [Tanacetum coccineum]
MMTVTARWWGWRWWWREGGSKWSRRWCGACYDVAVAMDVRRTVEVVAVEMVAMMMRWRWCSDVWWCVVAVGMVNLLLINGSGLV